MNKKFKYTSLVAAGLVTVGLVGGTFAYFTSSDTVTNSFLTGQTDKPDKPNSGVEIGEEFDQNSQLLPGVDVNKDVQVHNTANYAQFIRVKFNIKFYELDANGNKTTTEKTGLNTSMVELNTVNVVETVTTDGSKDGNWVQVGNYYYYIGKVAPKDNAINYTSNLLDSVTLKPEAGDAYKNVAIDVEVIADSIQAAGGAFAATTGSGWGLTETANEDLYDTYTRLEAESSFTSPVEGTAKLPEVK